MKELMKNENTALTSDQEMLQEVSPSLVKSKISKNAWVTIFFLFTLSIINVADKSIIGLVSVPIMKDLNLSPTQWGIVGSSFFWLFSISALTIGILSDKIGTKKVITSISSVWAVVQFATVFAVNLPYLVVTRIILGAGEGPTYGLSMSMAAKSVPKEKMGTAMTLVSVGNTVGAAIAAPILIFFISRFSWHAAFLFMGIIGLIWTISWIFLVKNDATEQKEVAKSTTKSNWKEVLPLLLSKNFILISLCTFASYWFFSIELSWLPNYFSQVRHLDGTILQVAIMAPWVITTISQLTFSTLSDKLFAKTQNLVKSRIFIAAPLVILAAACYVFATLVDNTAWMIIFFCLAISFRSIMMVLGPAIISTMFNKEHYGKAQGSFTAIYYLAGILAPLITGIIIQNATSLEAGFHQAFYLAAGLLAITGIIFGIFSRPKVAKTTN